MIENLAKPPEKRWFIHAIRWSSFNVTLPQVSQKSILVTAASARFYGGGTPSFLQNT